MNTTDLRIRSNKVCDIERYIAQELNGLYPLGEIQQMTRMLFEAYLGWDTTAFLLHRDKTINQSDLLKFHWAVEHLLQEKPIQQIIGYTDFCGCRIIVDENVLVPRPETEEIVTKTIPIIPSPSPIILDLCTGSGCIAIALSKAMPKAQIFGVDISEKALAVARENTTNNQAAVTFCQCDILSDTLPLPYEKYDVIISNPPYICYSEESLMHRNVLDYEPREALFVSDNDPLIFYRTIGKYAQTHLTENGILVFEINEHFGQETCDLLQHLHFSTQLYQDFRDKDRMVVAKLQHPIPLSENQ